MMTTRRSFLAVGGAVTPSRPRLPPAPPSPARLRLAAGGITLWTHNGGNK